MFIMQMISVIYQIWCTYAEMRILFPAFQHVNTGLKVKQMHVGGECGIVDDHGIAHSSVIGALLNVHSSAHSIVYI